LLHEGSARLNLTAFVMTWTKPQANRLMAENITDKEEYPQTAALREPVYRDPGRSLTRPKLRRRGIDRGWTFVYRRGSR